MSRSERLLQTEEPRWLLEQWTKRIPEPKNKLEKAEEYDRFAEASFAESDKAFARELSLIIPHGANVVDIGSGPAAQDIELAMLRPDLHLLLLDYNPDMLELAQEKAEDGKILDQFSFIETDMTKLKDLHLPQNPYVFSNTAFHELRRASQLKQTFAGLAHVVGEKGSCYIRDLLRPKDEKQAEEWRAQVLGETGDDSMSSRQLELFRNSQRAGFSIEEVKTAIDATSLIDRGGTLTHPEAPNSRYWIYEIKPAV